MALDGTLTQERVLTAGTGITLTDGGANGNATLNVPSSQEQGILDGMYYEDIFEGVVEPFWYQTDFANDGDWTIDVSTDNRIEGTGESADYTIFREGIEGAIDYSAKFTLNSATSAGFRFWDDDESDQVRFVFTSSDFLIQVTGQSDDTTAQSDDPVWLRVTRIGKTWGFYYKTASANPWILLATKTKDMGLRVQAAFDTSNTGTIEDVRFLDLNMPDRIVGTAPLTRYWGNQSGNVTIDCRTGNVHTMTLTGNVALQNPVYPIRSQMLLLKLEQDGTGNRTISFDTKFRFSTDLPSPTLSVGAGDIDRLGFIYDEEDDKWDYIAEVKGF
jgi:hypothetical protein